MVEDVALRYSASPLVDHLAPELKRAMLASLLTHGHIDTWTYARSMRQWDLV